jgi:hypothetical protein
MKLLSKYRTYMAANTGLLSGIFGFSGLTGLIFYLGVFFMTSLLISYKIDFDFIKFFKSSSTPIFSGIGTDLLVRIQYYCFMVIALHYDVGHFPQPCKCFVIDILI